jgi:hypothetical protein
MGFEPEPDVLARSSLRATAGFESIRTTVVLAVARGFGVRGMGFEPEPDVLARSSLRATGRLRIPP